jgi:aerobic carbon-monoxide dehydrogenase small subunit
VNVRLEINGEDWQFDVPPTERLFVTLRERALLTGTKVGCGIGECGACSVRVDGKLVPSCLVLTASIDGAVICTVEGLAPQEALSDLQQAFVEEGAVQCGYCTPGMLMAAESLLAANPRPTAEEIREGISGNLCRCTGYVKIVSAIQKTARQRSRTKRGR